MVINKKRYLVALDAGGTMTDTFLTDEKGEFWVGKALTNPSAEYNSYIGSVSDAARLAGTTCEAILSLTDESIYTGTTMLNLIMTHAGQNVGLLITKGMAGFSFLERALTWVGMSYADQFHTALHYHRTPLISRENVKSVAERIKGPTWYIGCHVDADTEVVPLNEEDVERGVNELIDNKVQVILILFLHSYASPAHERKAAEIARRIVKERGVDIPVVASYEICPLSFENERLKTLLLYGYCVIPGFKQLLAVEEAAKKVGFKHELETLLAYGATANIRYPRLQEAISSGPLAGLIGGRMLAAEVLGEENVICCDLGGTTFDASVIVRGTIPINEEPEFAGHRLRMPMLSIESIGAGTGSVIHVDPELKKITIGPESAASRVGICYQYPDITVGDVDVALGYLNPDYFLGGTVKLDKEKAIQELKKQLAEPLGIDLYEAGAKVIEFINSELRVHLLDIILARGYRPEDYILLTYGGSGPLHMWGLEASPPYKAMVTVPWAAAFSAFGVASADYFYRYEKTVTAPLPAGVSDEVKVGIASSVLNDPWKELGETAVRELAIMGFEKKDIKFRYAARGRYIGQMVSWEFPVEKGSVETIEDVNRLISGFESVYLSIYPRGARFVEAGYAITEVICEAVVSRPKPVIPWEEIPEAHKNSRPPEEAFKGKRDVFHVDKWIPFDTWEMDLLRRGNRIGGPAIIEHPMCTYVIPPGKHIDIDEHRVMWFRS